VVSKNSRAVTTKRCDICGSELRQLRLHDPLGPRAACRNLACLELYDARLQATGRKLPEVLASIWGRTEPFWPTRA